MIATKRRSYVIIKVKKGNGKVVEVYEKQNLKCFLAIVMSLENNFAELIEISL